jgi:FkbM family methyltransferase
MRRLNYSVYEECVSLGLELPGLPVFFAEHFGQCGEDLIVACLLRALATRQKINLPAETYLEIGGYHPVATSATYLIHRHLGMRGVIVEANPRLIPALRQTRAHDVIVHGAVQDQDVSVVMLSVSNLDEISSLDRSFVLQWDSGRSGERELIEVPALRVNHVIEHYLSGRAPLFLSVDVEGLDFKVLADLDFGRFRPAVIQAEPSDHHVPENSRTMVEFLESVGYTLIARTDVNLIFLDSQRVV